MVSSYNERGKMNRVFAALLSMIVLSYNLPAFAQASLNVSPWLDLQGGGISTGSAQPKPGMPDGGLLNGSLLPASGPGFRRDGPATDCWGAGHMVSLLENSAANLNTVIWPGMNIYVSEIAHQFGGKFEPHKSHQNGLDADVLYIGRSDWQSMLDANGNVTSRFIPEMNWAYWRSLFDQKMEVAGKEVSAVTMILVDPHIKSFLCAWTTQNGVLNDPQNLEMMRRIRPTEGHDDHFHIRLRCSPYHTQCVQEGLSSDLGCPPAQ